MPDRSDYTTGETRKVGARVDSGIYSAFRQWVEQQEGRQYNAVGDALERAMMEYMDKDRYQRIEEDVSEIKEQTKLNEALLRQLTNGDARQIERSQNSDTVPKGKDPGDRKTREAHVIRGLLENGVQTVKLGTLKEAITEFAGVSSKPTVKDYVRELTDTAAFQNHRRGNTWRFDHDGAVEVLQQRGVSVPDGVVV